MFREVKPSVLAFDVEWVPDPESGRAVYGLPGDMDDADVIDLMWKEGGATEDDPMPFIKTVLCRIVSISMVFRKLEDGGDAAKLTLHSIPSLPTSGRDCSERRIIGEFFRILNKHRPQLVGYNSTGSDIPILAQRMIKHGVAGGFFTSRPDRPWEGADFFSRGSDWNVDLMRCVSAWGKGTPSLHEISVVSGIPGKMGGVTGQSVAPMWLAGRLDEIVAYNECDALTTYLLWLRMAHSAGHFDSGGYEREQSLLRDMVRRESASAGREHLGEYVSRWEKLSGEGADE